MKKYKVLALLTIAAIAVYTGSFMFFVSLVKPYDEHGGVPYRTISDTAIFIVVLAINILWALLTYITPKKYRRITIILTILIISISASLCTSIVVVNALNTMFD